MSGSASAARSAEAVRLAPEQKPRPSPVRIAARTPDSGAVISRTASCSPCATSSEAAFSVAGSFSVMVAIASAISTLTFGVDGMAFSRSAPP